MSKDLNHVAFSYIPDKGPMGVGTLPRHELGFSRVCGGGLSPDPCPGDNGSSGSNTYRIFQQLVDLYQSGLPSQRPTVSSFFDIQARRYQIMPLGNFSYLQDVYRPLTTLILDDRLQAVEGLVVDMQHPKIGFRNHTAPTKVQYGAEWDEDLLFLEPESKCIDLNISVLFNSKILGLSTLVDKGGFVNMNITSPWNARIVKDVWNDDIQEKPALDWRAQAIGWSLNFLLARFLNKIESNETTAFVNSWLNKGSIDFADRGVGFGWDNQIDFNRDYSFLRDPAETHIAMEGDPNKEERDWIFSSKSFNITQANLTALGAQCDGYDHGGFQGNPNANISNIQVMCGLLIGTAYPTSEKRLISKYKARGLRERPIYSCASTTKATIKTVRFRYNSTRNERESMNGLEVLNIIDKVYTSDNDRPLWGVEDINMSVFLVNPLWGIIDPSRKDSVTLSSVRAEGLYLPAGRSLLGWGGYNMPDFTPAITGPGKAWRFVYESKRSYEERLPDYSGYASAMLSKKWDNLSHTAEGAAQILNLIFTDYAANMLTGTRSQLTITNLRPNMSTSGKKDQSQPGQVPVYLYRRIIRYRWVYGIPAFLSLLPVALILVSAAVALLTDRGSIKRVKHYLWNLSAGRILTTFIYPESSHMYSDTKEWIRAVGVRNITITHDDPPRAGSPDIKAEVGSSQAPAITNFENGRPDEEVDDLMTHDAMELRSISGSVRTFVSREESIATSPSMLWYHDKHCVATSDSFGKFLARQMIKGALFSC